MERAAAITGVPAEVIGDLARELGSRKPASIRIGYGVDRWYYCDYTARAAANLVIATGNIAVPGAGISVHDGTYSAPLNLNGFRAPAGREAATLDAISLMQAIEHGTPYAVKALWLSASNMFNQTSANRDRVMSAVVPKLDLIVVVDHFMTDTADMADIVLPACTIFEKADLVAGMFLQMQRKAVEPEGESKADFDIFAGLARRMGLGEYFDQSPDDYLREMLATGHPLLEGITLERLKREDAVFLNRPRAPYVAFKDLLSNPFRTHRNLQRRVAAARRRTTLLPRAHRSFSGKSSAPALSIELALFAQPPPHPLDLCQYAESQAARTGARRGDARGGREQRSIGDERFVRVYNQRGSVRLKCRINTDLRPGVVVISEGSWVKDFPEGDPYSLTHELVSATSENYAFYDTLAEVEAVDAAT